MEFGVRRPRRSIRGELHESALHYRRSERLYIETEAVCYSNGSGVAIIRSINDAISQCRATGSKVVYIRQVNRSWAAKLFSQVFTQGLAIQWNPGCDLDDRLVIVSEEVFDKEKPSSFSSKEFVNYLASNNVNELALAGLDGRFCINATAKDALRRGLKADLLGNAIASAFPKRWINVKQSLKSLGAKLKTEIGLRHYVYRSNWARSSRHPNMGKTIRYHST
jgi:nicotinamidase-related amidase